MQGGVSGTILEATSMALNKVFGMREDVASEIGRRLFTAKPAEREAILTRLESLSPGAMASVRKELADMGLALTAATSGQAAQGAVELPKLPAYIKEPAN